MSHLGITLYDYCYDNCYDWGRWDEFFQQTEIKGLVKDISTHVETLTSSGIKVSPSIEEIFEAFIKTDIDKVKAVILGQDPAPEPHLADGLAFCIQEVPTSHVPSIQRMLLEARNEGFNVDIMNGNIEKWAEEGVLLLNTCLTIPFKSGSSHGDIDAHKKLWAPFTQRVFKFINHQDQPISYILWGSQAGSYSKYITNHKHQFLMGGHPSPEAKSENFFCKNYFINTNTFLKNASVKPIDWNLTNEPVGDKRKGIWHWDAHNRKSIYIGPCPCSTINFI